MLARVLQVAMPCLGFLLREWDFRESSRQISTCTGLLSLRAQPRNGATILEQNVGNVLISNPVHAICKVTGGLSHTYCAFHKIILSEFMLF